MEVALWENIQKCRYFVGKEGRRSCCSGGPFGPSIQVSPVLFCIQLCYMTDCYFLTKLRISDGCQYSFNNCGLWRLQCHCSDIKILYFAAKIAVVDHNLKP